MSKVITTRQQYAVLLEMLQQKPEMAQRFTKCPKEEAAEFWKTVAEELNSIGPPSKDITSWKKVWLDWKAYIKRKLAFNKRELAATGGGQNKQNYFNEMEEAVIRLTALETSTHGIENTVSVGLPLPENVGNECEADVSMASVTCSPAIPRRTPAAQKPTDNSAAELLKEQLLLQKDFQAKTLQHFAIQDAKLEELSSGMRRLYRATEKLFDMKKEEMEETRRHNIAVENLIAEKNLIKKQMLSVE